jgi:UDP-N-acetylglucosamine 2-epimerase (non-hydrolysing)
MVIGGISEGALLQAVELAVSMRADGPAVPPVPDYADINVSQKVVKLIQSYTGIVNRVIWGKLPPAPCAGEEGGAV